MHILIVNNTRIPALKYGGTERVIWWLGKALVHLGHRVTYLVSEGSKSSFAEVKFYKPGASLNSQIPPNVDLIHLHFLTEEKFTLPCLTTVHGNIPFGASLPLNSVFVSRNHASRHGSNHYVYNGLDFGDYGDPGLDNKRGHYHFLANASWRVKNVKGAIDIARKCKEKLLVVGGNRLNFKMGFRFTPYLNVRFKGQLGGEEKNNVLRSSKGLIFPVLWNEPFGLAITESMYFGCPVFGTPYGSLPELINSETGFLSTSKPELVERILNNEFKPEACHQHVLTHFGAEKMAENYIGYYQRLLNGEKLHQEPPTLKQASPKFLPFND